MQKSLMNDELFLYGKTEYTANANEDFTLYSI